ncbi:hypothetical protein BJ878DRAFT_393587, partial [Calycina marina]
GGKQFTLPCNISRNGYTMPSRALIDTRAALYTAMSSQFAIRIARAFNISFIKIPNPVCPKRYDGKSGAPMDRALLAYMTLMSRRIATPFLITDLGNHDIIIGQRFLKHFSILTDSRNYTLHWPERFPPTPV